MTIILTADEKISILNSHQKNIAFNQFNISVNKVEEQAKDNPDAALIGNYNDQIAQMDKQIAALQTEIDALTPEATKA